jgi:hypothetical protein
MSGVSYTHTELQVDTSSKVVELKLPYKISKTIKKTPLTESDLPNSIAPFDQETHFARFYSSQLDDPLIETYAYRILQSSIENNCDILTISPIQINNIVDSELNSYSFQLPAKIIPNCITITESSDALVIDLLLDINILITLNLKFETFFNNKDYLNLSNFYSWCNYSMPYSFDQRKPLLFKPFNQLNILCSTVDGGLLLMKRSSVESDFIVSPFTSISYINNIKSKFFFRNLNNKEFESIDFNGQLISRNSFIDILPITDDIFLTISVNKKLIFWSLSNSNILKEIDINNYLSESLHTAVLSPLYPNSILKLSYNFLSIMLSLDNCYIHIFKLNINDLSLDLISQLTPPNYKNFWIPIDYDMQSKDEICQFWISWIFSNSCFYQKCILINDENSSVDWSTVIESNKFEELKNTEFLYQIKKFNESKSLNRYSIEFIQSKYNFKTIQTALKIFNENIQLSNNLFELEIQIEDLINCNFNSLNDLQNNWIKFASVCQDINNKFYDKTFAIIFDNSNNYNNDPFILTLKGDKTYSIIKKSTIFESLYFNSVKQTNSQIISFLDDYKNDEIDSNDLIKLIDLIIDYSKGYSEDIILDMTEIILNFEENEIAKLMNLLFDKFIINIANETVVFELLNRLSTIQSASDLFQYLTIVLTDEFESFKINQSSKLTEISENLILKLILSNNLISKKIIFGTILILLTLDISKPIEILFEKFVRIFKFINFIDKVSLLKTKKNLIIKYLNKIYDGKIFIKNSTINLILNKILSELMNDKFIYFVLSELISINNSTIAIDFINYLPKNSIISIILEGVIYLECEDIKKSKQIFFDNADKIVGNYNEIINSEDINSISNIEKYITLILNDNKIDYFFNLSMIFESKKLYIESLEFAIQSSKNLIKDNSMIESDKENEIFYKIFELSLNLQEYELSFSAIKDMKYINRILPIRKFIYKLFQDNKLGLIIEFNYGENLDLVDELILKLGEESLKGLNNDIRLSLKYYRVLYALRLKDGNFRGSIESLYRFNSIILNKFNEKIFKDEEKFDILNKNYLIILNLIKTLENGDDWIIRYGIDDKSDEIVYTNALEEEYEIFKSKKVKQDEMLYLL